MTARSIQLNGVGLGLRQEFIDDLKIVDPAPVEFLELAPENWMRVGGRRGEHLKDYAERFPLVCHGLSLSIGGPAALDTDFIQEIKTFLDTYKIRGYSEHLSYCGDEGQLYDLMPIPFTEEAVHYVAERIKRVQDILERRIALENISYYAAPGQSMPEVDFINAVISEAQCDLLLDVNNVFVNSHNHGYDAIEFIQALQPEQVAYIHIAGHYKQNKTVIIDTHGADVIDPVWKLLHTAYDTFGLCPTLLERDFNVPPLAHLLDEVTHIRTLRTNYSDKAA